MLVIEDILGRCAPLLGHRPGRAAPPQLLRRRARPRPTASRSGTPSGCVAAWDQVTATARPRRAPGRDRGVQRRAPAHQARAGDHAGEVRHLVQLHDVQPGRRAGARLQGRLGADQPRRHRDGPGAAHQDAPGRGHRARRCRWTKVRLAPTRTDKVPNTSATAASAPAPTSTAARSRTPATRSWPGWCRSAPSIPTCPGTSWSRTAYHQRDPAVGGRLLQDRGAELGPHHDDRHAVQVLRVRRRRRPRSRSTGSPAAYTHAARRHRARRRRQPLAAGRPRADRGRLRAGRRLADPGGPALGRADGPGRGRLTTQAASTYKLPSFSEMPDRVQRRAARAGRTRTARSTAPRPSASRR